MNYLFSPELCRRAMAHQMVQLRGLVLQLEGLLPDQGSALCLWCGDLIFRSGP